METSSQSFSDPNHPAPKLTELFVAYVRHVRALAKRVLPELTYRTVVCALLAGYPVIEFGYLGHLNFPEAALLLSSPMIDTNHRSRSFVVQHEEAS